MARIKKTDYHLLANNGQVVAQKTDIGWLVHFPDGGRPSFAETRNQVRYFADRWFKDAGPGAPNLVRYET